MKSRIFRTLALSMATVLFSTGCMMSRLVDRAFLGITVRRPTYIDRKTTGVFLLPFTFVLDVATFPIQALLVVILGDNFPFTDAPDALSSMTTAMLDTPRFQQLGVAEQAIAKAELQQLILDKKLTPNTALALGEDGHWTLVELSADTRNQLIARAQQPQAPEALVCERSSGAGLEETPGKPGPERSEDLGKAQRPERSVRRSPRGRRTCPSSNAAPEA